MNEIQIPISELISQQLEQQYESLYTAHVHLHYLI